eukprot:gene38072-46257_t
MFRLIIVVALIALLGQTLAQIRVTCIGDSITYGSCAENSGGYPALLQGMLGPDFTVMNFGNGGKTMMSMGLDEDGHDAAYIHTSTWSDAYNSKPDIVTIMLGTNDAKNFNWMGIQDNFPDSYVVDYLRMIRAMRTLPSRPEVFIMTLVPMFPDHPSAMNDTIINTILAPQKGLIQQIAQLAEVKVIDQFAAWQGLDASYTCDGCHPVDKGYQVIAQTMYEPILEAGKKRMAKK